MPNPWEEGSGAAQPAAPRRRSQPGLLLPTAKLSVGVGLVAAAVALLGHLLSLPLPFQGPGSRIVASLGATSSPSVPVSAGTAPTLYRGPYQPVLGEHDYGEGGARFGAPRGGRLHEGQDVFAQPGTPVIAVRDGVVIERNGPGGHDYGGGGNWLAIYSPAVERSYVYLHLLKPAAVGLGERVRAGQLVGQVGCTGSCYGDHLHFEIRIGRATWGADTRAMDPLPLLRRWPQASRE